MPSPKRPASPNPTRMTSRQPRGAKKPASAAARPPKATPAPNPIDHRAEALRLLREPHNQRLALAKATVHAVLHLTDKVEGAAVMLDYIAQELRRIKENLPR